MKYSIYELIITIKNVFLTKIFFPNSRFIRFPIYVRNRSLMEFGRNLSTGYNCRLEVVEPETRGKKIIIGNNVCIGDSVHISSSKKVIIGSGCLLASKIYISDNSHGNYSDSQINSEPFVPPNERPLFKDEVIIGNNVWIGDNVVIAPGVEIGNGCVIGANAFVNKKFGDNLIIAGVPARAIKRYCENAGKWVLIS